jgi:hypothetical protein
MKFIKGRIKALIGKFIIGFGFLSGVWFSIGIDPEKAILALLGKYIEPISMLLQIIFLILPLVLMALTVVKILKAYKTGGIFGIIGMALAFISGTILIWNWIISLILLTLAVGIGLIAFRNRRKR